LYRLVLLLLPRPIRRKYGEAMEVLFADQLQRARRRGLLASLATTLGAFLDVLLRSLYERASAAPDSPGNPKERTMRVLLHDIRFAVRALWRSPRFTALALLTLALGIGANVALFSVVHGVVLRPLPFPEQERVVHLAWDRGSVPRGEVPAYKYEFWRERSRAFEAMTTWRASGVRLGEETDGAQLHALRVPHTFLDVVGWQPAVGRNFSPEDDRPGAPAVTLLGHGTWRTRFAGDPGIVGRTVEIAGASHTVIGVLPREFSFPHDVEAQASGGVDFLLPLRLEADPLDEGENYPLLGRLAPGVDRAATEADLARVYDAFASEHPELMNGGDRAMVVSSFADLYVRGAGDVLWALLGATVLVLLIACANVAALLLARGTARRGELAVRTALGAGRGRIVGHVLAESLVLAAAAGVVGLVLARAGVGALLGVYPGRLPRAEGIGLNGPVASYALAAALVTGVVSGLVAAWPVLRGQLGSALRELGARTGGRRRLRRAVLATEAAISLVLLVGAGLLVRTLAELRSVEPGFAVEGLLTAPLPQPSGGWEAEGGIRRVAERAVDELLAVPEVTVAAVASARPLQRGLNFPVGIQGRPEDYQGAVELRAVTPRYLEVLGIPLLRGRDLTEADDAAAPPVALVNETFARVWFSGDDPIGKRIEIGRYRDRYIDPSLDVGGTEIVGVIGDLREIGFGVEPRQTVFLPAAQEPEMVRRPPVLLVRGRGTGVRRAVGEALATMTGGATAASELRSMEEIMADALATERFNALLMGVFALVALALTAFGIYGVVSYGVRQQRREIGIRVALGARRAGIARLVVGQGMVPVLLGLLGGVVGALALGRFIESMLWGVEPTDPATIIAVTVLLAAVAAVSSWLPVREATRIDPNHSLRSE
jgi:predicted permease